MQESFKLPFEVISDESFPEEIKKIESELSKICSQGFFNSFDGKKLYYEYFLKQNAKASVVIVHGLSEFTKKFYEIIWYLLSCDYNVFVYDQRGHGRSFRMTKRSDMLHVGNFSHYARDLDLFINEVVLKASSLPIYIYSHSMGGGISALYLAEHNDKVKKAVMSAPLFVPCVGKVSHRVAKMSALVCSIIFGRKAKFPTSREFNPEIPHREGVDGAFSRWNYNMDLRRNNKEYQTTPMSNGWVYSSLCLYSQAVKGTKPDKIKTPILLISAKNDKVVEVSPQLEFADKCKACSLVSLESASHNMLSAEKQIIVEHMVEVIKFFEN